MCRRWHSRGPVFISSGACDTDRMGISVSGTSAGAKVRESAPGGPHGGILPRFSADVMPDGSDVNGGWGRIPQDARTDAPSYGKAAGRERKSVTGFPEGRLKVKAQQKAGGPACRRRAGSFGNRIGCRTGRRGPAASGAGTRTFREGMRGHIRYGERVCVRKLRKARKSGQGRLGVGRRQENWRAEWRSSGEGYPWQAQTMREKLLSATKDQPNGVGLCA